MHGDEAFLRAVSGCMCQIRPVCPGMKLSPPARYRALSHPPRIPGGEAVSGLRLYVTWASAPYARDEALPRDVKDFTGRSAPYAWG